MSQYTLDITKDHCPMTFVKTKLELEKLKSGDKLEVLLREGEPLRNVPKSAQEQGYTVHDVSQLHDDVYKVLIEK